MMELNRKIPNLSPRVLQAPTPELPKASRFGHLKIWIFDAVSVILAAAVGYGLLLRFSGDTSLLLLAPAAGLFLIASFFSFLLAKDQRRQSFVALAQILAFLGFFYAVRISAVLSAFAALAVFYFLGRHDARAISENSLRFKLGPVARAYMKKIFLGFALAGIILYLPQWNSGNVFISQPQFQKWYDAFADAGEKFHVGLDLGASAGAFAEGVVRTQLLNNPQFRALSSSDQAKMVEKGIGELIGSMSKNVGFTITAETPLSESIYQYLLGIFTNFKNQFGDSFLAAWAAAVFVIVWSVGSLLIWAVILAAYLIFEILSAFNVVYISGESRTKEIVQIS